MVTTTSITAVMPSTAIAWTTAGSVAAVIEMVSSGSVGGTGFLKQEEIQEQVLKQKLEQVMQMFLMLNTKKLMTKSNHYI